MTSYFYVVYCSHIVGEDALTFAQNSFLTTLNSKLTHRLVLERLSYLICPGESQIERFSIIVSVNGGTPYVVNHSITVKQNVSEYCVVERVFDYNTLKSYIGVQGDVVIKGFSFSVGNRIFSFYYDNRMPNLVMGFRNAFNCFEVAVINGETKNVTKVDRSIATCNGINSFYDQTNERTYEVETAGVSKAIAEWLGQLMMSDDVHLCNSATDVSSWPKVMIVDSTSEVSDTDDKLNAVKFKWQFVDSLPYLHYSGETDKIFTYEFNNVYQ